MPTTVKCLLLFRDSTGNGWTEVHYWQTQSADPQLFVRLGNLTDVIAPLRAQLLSGDCAIIGTRVSYRRPNAVASLSKKIFLAGVPGQAGVSSDLSLACQFVDNSYTLRKITHLRGFWDSVEYNGEYHPEAPEAVGWPERLDAWKNALKAGSYGWLAKESLTSRAGVVAAYTAEDDNRITFSLALPGLTGVPIGSTVQMRFSRLNGGSSVLNRSFLVLVNTVNNVTTINPVAAGPNTGPGRYNYRSTAFVPYQDLQNIGLGRRAQGKPLGRAPGRSKARPLI
jgi:hypothetical protein